MPTNGSLVIVGGGDIPPAVLDAFVERAGGVERTKLVVMPGASLSADDDTRTPESFWKGKPLRHPIFKLHTRSRKEADTAEFAKPLKTATGVWIGGGWQERLSSAYQGTEVEKELINLLERGCVIGGTSAGAAIMCPDMIQDGKETAVRGKGFALVGEEEKIFIDQHYYEKEREPRFLKVLAEDPNFSGIGVGERVAFVIDFHDRMARVVGDNRVRIKTPHISLRDLSPGETVHLDMFIAPRGKTPTSASAVAGGGK